MRRLLLSLFAIGGLTSTASAQQPFAPYTISEQEHQAILNYLGDVPSKYSNPLISGLMQMEQKAQQKKIAPVPAGNTPAAVPGPITGSGPAKDATK